MASKKKQKPNGKVEKPPLEYLIPNGFLNTTAPLNVMLYGVGGTGSIVLSKLPRMDASLKAMGHPGIIVYAVDIKTVRVSNVGKQLFTMADVGKNKATAMITKINRSYSLGWFDCETANADIFITCTDSIFSRKEIAKKAYSNFWIDAGNGKDFGQVVLGGRGLKNVMQLYPKMFDQEEDLSESCSILESIGKQDLYVNDFMADMVVQLMWSMFKGVLKYQGSFINLKNYELNPIKIHAIHGN